MERKIKFRIWHPEKKAWLKKGLFESDDFQMKGNFHSQILVESPIPTIIQQFTGLKDKKGKEIYEGDILLMPDEHTERILDYGEGPTEPCSHVAEVIFENGGFGVNVTD